MSLLVRASKSPTMASAVFLLLLACTSPHAPNSTQSVGAALPTAPSSTKHTSVKFHTPSGKGFPEGIAWHRGKNAFVVSSLRSGTIGLVSPDGRYQIFNDDPRLISTAGIVVDAPRKRILVTNSDVGASSKSTRSTLNRTAQVIELDMDSGAIRRVYDFSRLSSGATLANDLTVDKAGNIYVTDSFQPQIYQVRHADKSVSVLVNDPRLNPDASQALPVQPNLNGIVYHDDGYLIASDYARGKLWNITLATKNIQEVRLTHRLKGSDGLVRVDDNTLAAIQTAPINNQMQSYVTYLHSADNWQSASVVREIHLGDINGLTTGTLKDGKLWAVNSRYPELFGNDKADDITAFELISLEK